MNIIKSITFRLCRSAFAVGLVLATASAESIWLKDLDTAAQKAQTENKLLLVEFTGSDWCKFCLLQKQKVLEHPRFTAWMKQHCIPVEIDVPHDASRVGGELQKRRNSRIIEECGVRNFPTLKVMTPELVIVGGCMGAQNTPEKAIAELKKSFPAVRRLKAAMQLQGTARVQALMHIYTSGNKGDFHLLRLIAESDPQNTSGLVPEYEQQNQLRQLNRKLDAASTTDECMSIIDGALAEALPDNLSAIRRMKGNTMRQKALQMVQSANSMEDVNEARQLMYQSLQYSDEPHDRFRLKAFIDNYFANPVALLEKASRKKQ